VITLIFEECVVNERGVETEGSIFPCFHPGRTKARPSQREGSEMAMSLASAARDGTG
jgi:hypothetical protein